MIISSVHILQLSIIYFLSITYLFYYLLQFSFVYILSITYLWYLLSIKIIYCIYFIYSLSILLSIFSITYIFYYLFYLFPMYSIMYILSITYILYYLFQLSIIYILYYTFYYYFQLPFIVNVTHSSTPKQTKSNRGSGCGSVVGTVASNTRGPRFDSSHWQNFYFEHLHSANCIEKTKIKQKEAGNGLFKNPI